MRFAGPVGRAAATAIIVAATLSMATTQRAAGSAGPAPSTSATSPPSWTIVPSPDASSPTGSDVISGVSCVSATFCIAVGRAGTATDEAPLIEQWDGRSWTAVDAPAPSGTAVDELGSVSCLTASFCLAVGAAGNTNGVGDNTLTEQWNGSAWTIVPSPSNPANETYGLDAISCSSTSECTAVGDIELAQRNDTLVESWNGSEWSVIASPNSASTSNQLNSVSCLPSGFCAAVGIRFSDGTEPQTLAETSSGGAWSVSTTANPGPEDNELFGISCVSASRCVAVGTTTVGSTNRPLAESFGGTAWSTTKVPAFGGNFRAVSCDSATTCAAVGAAGLIDTWNGTTWTVNPTPQTKDTTRSLAAVSCVGSDECTVGGDFLGGDRQDHTFVEKNCTTDDALTDGDWKVDGCFLTPDPADDDATDVSTLDGIVVTPASKTTVDYATDARDVTSTGDTTLDLNLTPVAGHSDDVPIFSGPLDLNLSGGPVTIALPAAFALAGIPMTGALTLAPGAGGTVTGTGTGTLPAALGGGQATVTFTSTLAKGVTKLTLSADAGSLAQLYRLDHITLSYDKGTWTVEATAVPPTGARRTVSGSLTYDAKGLLSAGRLQVANLSLGGLVTIKKFTVSYSKTKGWSGSAELAQGAQAAIVALSFDAQGDLTTGSLHASGVTLFQVFDLKTFDLDYTKATGVWELSVTVAHEKSGAEASAAFSESNGEILGVSLDLKHVEFLRKITVNDLDLSYEKDDGHTTYSGDADLELPGTVVSGVEGELTFTDGDFTHAKLVLHGNVPIFEVVFLNSLGAEISLEPHHEVKGSVGLSAGPKIDGESLLQLDGTLGYRFPDNVSSNGVYTLTGAISALEKTLGEGTITVNGDRADLAMSLGKSGQGFALGKDASLKGRVTGHIVRRSFTARGDIALTLDIHGHHFEANADATLSNRGIVVCGRFPGVASGESGVAEEWGHAPTIKRGDCAPANF